MTILFLLFAGLVMAGPAVVFSEGAAKEEAAPQNGEDSGSIKLRVVAVNPSAEKTQKVPIKIYLPKEVIPDDIISMGELEVGYDSEKSMYYAYSEGVDLSPQETRIFEVHLEDVWRIPDQELDTIRKQTGIALKHLENTEYFAMAKTLVDSIDRRVNEITVKQTDLSISREEHIGAYRVNQIMMDQIKQDVARIEKLLLMHTGSPVSIDFLKDTVFEQKESIDRITAWKLILAIVGVIIALGLGLFFVLLPAIRSRRTPNKAGKRLDQAPSIKEHVEEGHGIKARSAEIEEESEEVDIEKLLEPEDKDKRDAA